MSSGSDSGHTRALSAPLDACDTQDTGDAIRETVTQCFLAHRYAVYRYLRCTQCDDAADAEEITQEAFLRLHWVLVRGQHIEDMVSWVFKVAQRIAIDRRRRQHYERPLLVALGRNLADTLPDDGVSCEEDLQQRQRRAAFIAALQELTPLQRQCLELRAQGYSLKQIGGFLNVSPQSITNAVWRAVRRLRQHLHV